MAQAGNQAKVGGTTIIMYDTNWFDDPSASIQTHGGSFSVECDLILIRIKIMEKSG